MISDKVLYLIRDTSFGKNPPLMLGIGVEIIDGRLHFHSTSRGHNFGGHIEKETKDGFVWHRVEELGEESKDLGFIYLKMLTLEEYNKKVRPHVQGPVPNFASDE